ncbi:MAG: aldehyde dehydrogenase family protein [Syntrophobacterales bacterium]|nr:aldehyde dehydrogenase family protein [Syntrophobacterales bacterium]
MSNNCREMFPSHENDIPERFTRDIPVVFDQYLIGGRLRSWDGSFREVCSPVCVRTRTGTVQKVIGMYPLMTERESCEALSAAVGAYDYGRGTWPAMSLGQRIEQVEELVSGMLAYRDRITTLLMWEIGKSYHDAQHEFDRTVHYVRDVVGAFRDMSAKPPRIVEEHGIVGRIGESPLGVVLCIGPFNYPLFETFTALVPALLAGNTVIFKLPRYGALIYQPLLEVLAGLFPAGVVNMISGEGRVIIPSLLASGQVDGFAFIGTSEVASFLRGLHPKPHRLRCILGLEAKNPAIILADADLETAVKECLSGALAFNGQRCAALKIFFVHVTIMEEFLNRLSGAVENVKCGMPWDDGVMVTPLVEPGKPVYLKELTKDAVGHGAMVVNEKGAITDSTFFYPAILSPVTSSMRIYREEQFGPLIPVVPFNDIDKVIRYVQDSNYGQQASVFGRDMDEIALVANFLTNHVSRVNINCQCQRSPDTTPFTGRKDSGEGSLSVSDAITAFTVPSFISARDTEENRKIVEVTSRMKNG